MEGDRRKGKGKMERTRKERKEGKGKDRNGQESKRMERKGKEMLNKRNHTSPDAPTYILRAFYITAPQCLVQVRQRTMKIPTISAGMFGVVKIR